MHTYDSTPTPKKPISGAQLRKRRVERGLPKYSAAELAARKENDLRRSKRKYAERSAMIDAIKIERGCVDCGYRVHPAALDFDHLPGQDKQGIVARLAYWARMEVLLAEIAKCEVVCANCHRIRTADRLASSTTIA